jgi:F0F1-type ATP synthase assembly protein I
MARESLGWSNLLGMGAVVAVLLVGGVVVGWLLDGVWHTSPIMVIVGVFLGIAVGITYTIVQIRPFLKR